MGPWLGKILQLLSIFSGFCGTHQSFEHTLANICYCGNFHCLTTPNINLTIWPHCYGVCMQTMQSKVSKARATFKENISSILFVQNCVCPNQQENNAALNW